jgi:GYF domain 2
MNHMSSPASQTQWFLAREGQQYGPLSDVELAKIIELGHLQPNDLLWREGFPDWRPALVVFPPRKPGAPRPPAPSRGPAPFNSLAQHPVPTRGPREQPMARQGQMPRSGPAPGMRQGQVHNERYAEPDEETAPRGRLKKTLVVLVCLGALGAGGWYAYPKRKMLMEYVKALPMRLPAGLFETGGGTTASGGRQNIDASPLKGFIGTPEAVDATLQATPLWRVVKRDYPDWYSDRLKEAATLAAENKDDSAIAQSMARALVALRRQNSNHALAASFANLKAVATSFYANLVELRKHSVAACYEFISQGESGPTVVSLMQDPVHAGHLQAQLTDVFEAIADGRKAARVYPQPRKTDYDTLAADLTKRGWSQADLQLFSDERALARAGPEKVCQLVHDWFAAQLAIKDPDMQLRLLVDSLRPVVAG